MVQNIAEKFNHE